MTPRSARRPQALLLIPPDRKPMSLHKSLSSLTRNFPTQNPGSFDGFPPQSNLAKIEGAQKRGPALPGLLEVRDPFRFWPSWVRVDRIRAPPAPSSISSSSCRLFFHHGAAEFEPQLVLSSFLPRVFFEVCHFGPLLSLRTLPHSRAISPRVSLSFLCSAFRIYTPLQQQH
ncbi:hypothetical protein VTG60DRAFT_6872 [Thermothelomyces hinnuleus]